MNRRLWMRSRTNSKRKGLTLIELIVTMMLLTIGLIGVSSMFIVGFRTQRHAHFTNVATDLVCRKMEEMKAAGFNAMDAALFPPAFQVSELPEGYGAITWEPYPTVDSDGQYLAHVIVTWGGGTGIGGRVAMSTVISRHA